ncbi:hypothetical protein KZZ52_24040 [Dactylosporangium sp. AC04546]|uniref:hypothetical protein n=1 Tax=Dactylosporangium sp. AC04546 TaxID=2862460 RepID=UPI001EE01D62|nr:hypothetical protein [Dactylosporangium sp. AC04546]WVK88347.1 hypothetical protein KZZ52_24040 [Dactylosporangium sp. AC04546]
MVGDDRIQQTGAYLRMLLRRSGEYRAEWQRFAGPVAPEEIDYAAVARVLAQSGGPPSGPLAPIEVTRQALEGTALAADTLTRFVTAFRVRPRHAERLTGLLRGSANVRVINDDVRLPAVLGRAVDATAYESLSLHERHTLGPDGRPAEHQTIQVLRSRVDDLTSLPYRFDTDELVVEVVRGGSVGEVYRLTDTLHAVDILLDEPLHRGDSTLMQYRTNFFYRTAPPPEFRRGVLSSTKDLTIWVTFHPDRVPRRVWLARWDALDHARITEEEPVELDDEGSVHCRLTAIERTIVGFHWEWA